MADKSADRRPDSGTFESIALPEGEVICLERLEFSSSVQDYPVR